MKQTLRLLALGTSVEFIEAIDVIHSDPGYEAIVVSKGMEFATKVEQHDYDIVIAEEGGDNEQLAVQMAKAKASNPSCFVLLASNDIAAIDPVFTEKSKVDGLLGIPMSLTSLTEAIRRLSEKSTGDKKKTLLIVDDIYSMRFLLRKILEAAGYNVLEADNAAKATTMLALSGIDAVLLDVMMPGMTGLELCEKLKSSPTTAKVPVIMVTARGTKENVQEGLDAGAAAYIVKPFTRQDICDKVEQAINAS